MRVHRAYALLSAQNEVNALLSQSTEDVPDAELDEELAQLESEALPAAPTKTAADTTEPAQLQPAQDAEQVPCELVHEPAPAEAHRPASATASGSAEVRLNCKSS